MIRVLLSLSLLLLLTVIVTAQASGKMTFTSTAGTVFTVEDPVYPSRINNYCLFPGAIATASSSYSGYPPSGVIDGDRIGQNCNFTNNLAPCWGNNGGWNDGTWWTFPDSLTVTFDRARSVGRVVIVTFQDNFSTPRIEPYLGLQVGGNYGNEKYQVQVLSVTSGQWITVADIDENYDIVREHVFTPILATAMRVSIDEAPEFSRVAEFEAYAN